MLAGSDRSVHHMSAVQREGYIRHGKVGVSHNHEKDCTAVTGNRVCALHTMAMMATARPS